MYPLMMSLLLSLSFGGIANAHPTTGLPEVSLGSNPHRAFIGPIAPGEVIPLLELPAGQEFIVTMVATTEAVGSLVSSGEFSEEGIRVLQDSSIILSGHAIYPESALGHRNGGRLRVQSGSTLSIQSGSTSSANASYHLQGYFVQAPSPYRSSYGIAPPDPATMHTVFTNTESQDFMLRTVNLRAEGGGPVDCDLYIDGAMVVEGRTQFALVTTSWSTLPKGTGTIQVPAGSVIQIYTTNHCQYYIDGEYITP